MSSKTNRDKVSTRHESPLNHTVRGSDTSRSALTTESEVSSRVPSTAKET
jgi:hypothetical protein